MCHARDSHEQLASHIQATREHTNSMHTCLHALVSSCAPWQVKRTNNLSGTHWKAYLCCLYKIICLPEQKNHVSCFIRGITVEKVCSSFLLVLESAISLTGNSQLPRSCPRLRMTHRQLADEVNLLVSGILPAVTCNLASSSLGANADN